MQLGVVAPHRVCQGVGTHGVGATSEPVGATVKSWGEEATDARALFLRFGRQLPVPRLDVLLLEGSGTRHVM